MTDFLFGHTTFLVKGTNVASLLKTLKRKQIAVKLLKPQTSTTFLIKVKSKDSKKLVAILKEKCYNVIEQKSSFEKQISFFKRTGILVGIFVGVVVHILSSFFVLNFQLFGDETFKPAILNALKENGISTFCLKSQLNSQKIKEILYQNVPNLSLLSVSTRGTTLQISFTTRTKKEQQPEQKQNILAKDSGIVASIIVLEGTAVVKVGDFVKKGQTLIEGICEKDGKQVVCEAKGQVFAYAFKSATIEFPLDKIVCERTGNYVENFEITYLGSCLHKSNNKIEFEKFETEISTKNLSDHLPIKITYLKSFELKETLISQNFEEQKQNLEAQAKLLAWELVAGNETILEEKNETNLVANVWFVSHYIKIKEKIS